MRRKNGLILLVIGLLALLSGHPARAQTATPPALEITAPAAGAALQGLVQVNVQPGLPDVQNAELAFAYTGDTTGTWFLIWESGQPIDAGELAVWDTTTITDGDYDLRLLVTTAPGEQLQSLVRGLRVRNYTPIETSTPAPVQQQTPTPTSTPTPLPSDTPAPLVAPPDVPASNPASLGIEQVRQVALRAGLVVLLMFLLGMIYVFLRSWLRNRL